MNHGVLLLRAALQAFGFACVSVAALLELRALLGRRPPGLDGPPLHWTRAGFLLFSGALVVESVWTWDAPGGSWPLEPSRLWNLLWCLLCWLVFFAVLHVHRVKAFKGRPENLAGLAGWALTAATGAWLAMR